ncbi:fumarylacetoacetate hydrolase [Listeria newyorkensis]|uniref:Fumarylacetoacetate hydrolase n=1 Tax=Listeria newyorkensis TaxID=1497681 RepID=A0ABX4XKE8_9LIST|nr:MULTISPECIES: fumarylacetoacetate hydrolase family protein [Listeria]KGL44380.1 fumarylacetoacetate hydrolase [Listeriaceae bacterium FSL A5-0209]KGL42508.1 fumarylacetoacetate hydrolase [Listeria newyorkensis]PNP90975.1 fumarylacetoacetate hydrolase [Listeria newyorkensis]RQW65403.1 FAA hydrolase family protein [Listeria sp. SHR_NRA_18]WAO20327.1 fumarylacetoacetate hydrolase family protein [Listeria newyorkensis]
MKWISFRVSGRESFGIVKGDSIIDISAFFAESECPRTLVELIAQPAKLEHIEKQYEAMHGAIPCKDVQFLPAIVPPNNVMAVGKNYRKHVIEMGSVADIPEAIMIFTKSSNTLVGHRGTISLHAGVTSELDYEGELAIIIGKEVTNISEAEALDAIFGYTILNDVTARDLQVKHKQFYLAKSLDGSCPIGPYVVTKDEIGDPSALRIQTWVNGEKRQDGTLDQLIFPIATIISELSKGHTLMPGDVIATGTPDGVGKAMKPPRFLNEGDTVTITIEGIGTLENQVM